MYRPSLYFWSASYAKSCLSVGLDRQAHLTAG
jgi:hypothetical protein